MNFRGGKVEALLALSVSEEESLHSLHDTGFAVATDYRADYLADSASIIKWSKRVLLKKN